MKEKEEPLLIPILEKVWKIGKISEFVPLKSLLLKRITCNVSNASNVFLAFSSFAGILKSEVTKI